MSNSIWQTFIIWVLFKINYLKRFKLELTWFLLEKNKIFKIVFLRVQKLVIENETSTRILMFITLYIDNTRVK